MRQDAKNLLILLAMLITTLGLSVGHAALPKELPRKQTVKRTRIDFTKQEAPVISATHSARAAAPSTKTENTAVTIKKRVIVAAPRGDAAEPMSAFDKPKSSSTTASAPETSALPAGPTPQILSSDEFHQTSKIAIKAAAVVAPDESVEISEENTELTEPTPLSPPALATATASAATPEIAPAIAATIAPTVVSTPSAATTAPAALVAAATPVAAPSTISFLRAGYLSANYAKFDSRMSNNATSMGLGIARGFDTTWGAFEARAAFDVYHAMDQSVTIDNVRMLSVRTEVAYWLSHSRVKPGVSLGLGWADYSVRSYRSISDADESVVTLRTHAKSRVFTLIPATSLRVELGQGLMIDTQTEFLAILGGESANAVQGMGLTISLGWIF